MQRVVDFFHEGDQRTDVAVAQAGPGIVTLKLFDHPAGIINANVEAVVGRPQKCAGELAQFKRGSAGQNRQFPAAAPVDQAILKINPDLGIGSLK
jgi:hypothetical protein